MRRIKKIIMILVIMLMMIPQVHAATFTPRLTAPDTSNKYYIHTTYGGYNSCILISGNSVLPNCVGYAWGRAYEILGTAPNLSRGDANTWWNYNITNGYYSYSTTTPKLGAIMCWNYSNGGHVAVVEAISGNTITISESCYGGARWQTQTRTITDMQNYYPNFAGYIYIGEFSTDPSQITVSNASKPSTITQGTPFNLTGIISSGLTLTNATVGVYDLNGKLQTGVSVNPNAKTFNIVSVDTQVLFDALKPGIYEYKVTASNSNKTVKLISVYFAVLATNKTIDNGTYYISNVSGYRLGVKSNTNNEQIKLYSPDTSDYQKFIINHVGNGYYTITNKYSGKSLDVESSGTSNCTIIQQYTTHSGNNQLWQILPCGDTYTIVPKHANKTALDVANGHITTEGETIWIYTINASKAQRFNLISVNNPFTDIKESDWYYNTVLEVNHLGLMTGASDTLFKPTVSMNRGMVAIVLHRMEGSKSTQFKQYFKDVDGSSDEYYASSVTWAKENGVINGYSDNTFRPLRLVTREEMAQMLYNFAKYKGEDVSADNYLSEFLDGNKVSSWHRDAVNWAIDEGIISGKYNGTKIDPQGKATRAECAKMLLNTYKIIYF